MVVGFLGWLLEARRCALFFPRGARAHTRQRTHNTHNTQPTKNPPQQTKPTTKTVKTHRELFSDFYQSLFGTPLANLLATSAPPTHAPRLYHRMMRDILSGGGAVRDDFSRDNNGGRVGDSMQAACYALGYNLAIEYLADYEKTWMLDTFRGMLDAEQKGCLAQAGLKKEDVDWVFLEVHAEGEAEHAAIGHSAVLALVGEEDVGTLRAAMADHDRDFAEFYDAMADLLIEKSKE